MKAEHAESIDLNDYDSVLVQQVTEKQISDFQYVRQHKPLILSQLVDLTV